MSCNYKNECPSYSGWCEGPKQDFSMCVQFLVNAYERERAKNKAGDKSGEPQEIQKESKHFFYVIEAGRDHVRKYVSKGFPRVFQYTVKLSKARRFETEERAMEFIRGFNDYGKFTIVQPVVRKVCRTFSVVQEGEENE